MMESSWGTMQLELLDTKEWQTRNELANAIFEWTVCWYTPKRAIPASQCTAPSHSRPSTRGQNKLTDPTRQVSVLRRWARAAGAGITPTPP